MKNHGYTLIEIIIALAVFTTLAMITATVMQHTFDLRSRINQQASRLSSLQMFMALMERDTMQAVPSFHQDSNGQLSPVFVGTQNHLELTQDGYSNPGSLQKRSTLKHIAYRCKNNHLLRRSYLTKMNKDAKIQFFDKIMLNNLSHCSFEYLNQKRELLSSWQDALTQHPQLKNKLPIAIKLNLVLNDWGEMSVLFILPGGNT